MEKWRLSALRAKEKDRGQVRKILTTLTYRHISQD